MTKLALVAVAALALSGFSTIAMAQTSPGAGAPDFAKADANSDGGVDQGEFTAAFPCQGAQAFTQADTNKDGKLDANEYAAVGGEACTTGGNNGNNGSPDTQNGGNGGSSANGNNNGSSANNG